MSAPRLSGLAVVVSLAWSSASADAQSFDGVVAFGDSLSDNGNLFAATGFPPPPYWEGRFSDGRVWVEQLGNALGFDPDSIADFAVGGATTADVLALQVGPYVAANGGVLDPDSLYTVWAGASDLYALLADPDGDPAQVIADAMSNLGTSVGLLLAGGARHVLVVNLPDLSRIPLIQGTGDPVLIGSVLAVTQAFDAALAQTVATLEFVFGIHVITLDAFELSNELAASPRDFGLKNVTDPAFDGLSIVKKPADYLFWDDRHPTRVGHNALAARAFAALGLVWCDLDGSGVVDAKDLALLVKDFGPCTGGCPSDLNADGVVDDEDLAILKRARH
jgi:phospholipase/lecithinase/hemolysin